MKKYKELDNLILSEIQQGERPWEDRHAVELAESFGKGYGRSLVEKRMQSLRKAGKIHYAGLKWHMGAAKDIEGMRVLCSSFAQALVDVLGREEDNCLDKISFRDLKSLTGFPDQEVERILKARAEAEAFLGSA
jgi:hypothetical protein